MRRFFVLLGVVLAVAPCAASPEIPNGEKPCAICLYRALKSTPGITGVDAYVLKTSEPYTLLAYGYRDRKGAEASNYIVITLPPDGHYLYVGAFTQPDNPVNKAFKTLDAKCGIDSGYVDQVFFTDPSEHVDMDGLK